MYSNNYHGGSSEESWNQRDSDDDVPMAPIFQRIICTLFLIGFIIPNIYLIVTFMKHHFYKYNFFYTMVHWSFANLLHMVLPIYILYVPEDYKNETVTLAFLAVHCIVSCISLTRAIYLVFDKLFDSTNCCVRTIRSNWIITIVTVGAVLSLVCTHIINKFSVARGYIAFSSLIVLIFIVRLLHFWCKGSEEENYRLRVWISGIFIVSTYIFTSWIIVDVLLEMNIPGLLIAALIIILVNGLINTTLFYKYESFHPRDTSTEIAVTGIAQAYMPHSSQTGASSYSRNENQIVVEPDVEASDLPPKYDYEYEAPPPKYEDATKTAGIYTIMCQNADAPVYDAPSYEELYRYPPRKRINGNRHKSTA